MVNQNEVRMPPPKYYPFPRGSYDDIFGHISDIMCFLKKEGCITLDIFAFGDVYKNLKYTDNLSKLLSHSINLIMNGASDESFHFVLEYETLRVVLSRVFQILFAQKIKHPRRDGIFPFLLGCMFVKYRVWLGLSYPQCNYFRGISSGMSKR